MTTDTLRAGEIFGNFRIARELGRGGMGVVYEAESLDDGRVVALKLLLAGLDADDARQRFLREGRVASTLMHPNTVYVFGTQEIDGMPTIAMEYVAGGTLEDVVSATGPVPPADAIRMVGQVIDGLEAAYAGGILHRDIKPSNCFVAQDGSIKVGDFGLSRPTQGEDMRVTKTGMILGTPAYAPPEQLLGEPLDARSDIYSVGATLYFLLTGVLPFPGANAMVVLASVLQGTPAPPETHQPAIPKALSAIVLRAMARQPSERFADYAEFRAALDALSGVEVVPGRPLERVLAFLIDSALASLIAMNGTAFVSGTPWTAHHLGWRLLIIWGVFLCVRAIPEAVWGTSPGKRLFNLRTQRRDGVPISWLTSLGRSSLTFLSGSVSGAMLGLSPALASISSLDDTLDTLVPLILLSTMRRSNGYAAMHDRLFGTRVVKTRARQSERRFARGATRVSEVPSSGERLGAFLLGTPVFTSRDGSVVHDALDATLGRPVWLHRVHGDLPERTMARRNLARPARMRWVAGRRDAAQSFDVYGTPDGQRLIDLPAAVSWEVCRGWLADLADEMVAAQRDGETLRPAVDEIWVSEGQQVIVMDFAAVPNAQTPDTPQAGAIVHAVARRALCGAAAGASTPWPALPRSVRTWLDTLPRVTDPGAVIASLALLRNTSAQVTRAQRLKVAAIVGVLPALVVITILIAVVPKLSGRPAIQASLEPLISFATPRDKRLVMKVQGTAFKRTGFNFGVSLGKAMEDFEQSLITMSRDSSQRAAQIAAVDARRDTVARYLATTHGALLRDRTRRQQIVGDSQPWAALDSVFGKLGTVSAADSMRARQLVEREWHGTLPGRDNAYVQVIANCFNAAHVMLGIEGLFVVLFALSIRRGPVMRSVGFEVVDRSGQPATRLRLLMRAAATWAVLLPLPILVIEVVMYGIVSARSVTGIISYPYVWFGLVASGVSLILGGLVSWYGLQHPSRGVGDRIAGTTTVPE